MSSPVLLSQADDAARERALDPGRSFVARAPAGSGKTELLSQRFLRLLAAVERPESIVAITFTRKAAAEMLGRILDALGAAEASAPVEQEHKKITRALALAVLARDRERGWDVLHHPGRLRVQTIDSLCMAITAEMPWLARLGGMPRIEEDARPLYDEAARWTLLEENSEFADALTVLLRRLDNDAARARRLIATMLARRDQWLALVFQEEASERASLEKALRDALTRELERTDQRVPHDLKETWAERAKLQHWPAPAAAHLDSWRALAEAVLTKAGAWRKGSSSLISRLSGQRGIHEALVIVSKLPDPAYQPEEWETLRALLHCLRLSVGQLRLVFREQHIIDFVELGIAARAALGGASHPSELAFRMDWRIQHLLVDEFQDTSRGQFELLTLLTSGWQPGDGRTLFVVGDPMQSIYRFRQAEVGLFLEAGRQGLADLPLERVSLVLNRRSRPAIIERVNAIFRDSFPEEDDSEIGAIRYTPSQAARDEDDGLVTFDGFLRGEDQLEAECVLRRIREARARDPRGDVAILVRARTHLAAITQALKANGLVFQAVDIDPLGEHTVVQDLLALTCALLNARDRIAWLAILRAPWCGLTLADLEALTRDRGDLTIEESLRDFSRLSPDGQLRAARVLAVLEEALAERGRCPLRRWVERAWLRLGGPACLQADVSALADAEAYLDLLEAGQSGADIHDFSRFRQRVSDLFAPPANSTDTWLKVMTIHKAKGLEFDTVIVPGLGKLPKRDEAPLVLFHEWKEGRAFESLLAPVNETGAGKDALYRYLRGIEARKERLERARLLYVAATRAKKRLHLMGHAVEGRDGTLRPHAHSMLADLWSGLSEADKATFRREPKPGSGSAFGTRNATMRRLPASWRPGEWPLPVAWEHIERPPSEPHEPSFEWVGESLRRAGTVVHGLLQRMRGPAEVLPALATIRKMLAHAGVTGEDLDRMAQRVEQALSRTQNSARGRWVLGVHAEVQAEYAVSGVVDGEVVRGLVDRTFVDAGVRWIIDFKTSSHEGGDLAAFLDEQQRRYRDQMERYARIFAPLGTPVRLGLYFPLLDEWREWAPQPASGR